MKSEQIPESGEKVYLALLSQYSLVRDRNDVFVSRAQNLLGFAGIIDTILVALIVTVVTEEKVRALLELSPYLFYIKLTIFIGFLGYIFSILFALFAFRTTKYMPVPQINSKEFINDVFKNKVDLSQKHLAIQVYDAIEYYNKKNAEKYRTLFLATVFLVIAIGSTAFLGILILTMV